MSLRDSPETIAPSVTRLPELRHNGLPNGTVAETIAKLKLYHQTHTTFGKLYKMASTFDHAYVLKVDDQPQYVSYYGFEEDDFDAVYDFFDQNPLFVVLTGDAMQTVSPNYEKHV